MSAKHYRCIVYAQLEDHAVLSVHRTFKCAVLSLTSVALAAFNLYVPSSAQLPAIIPAPLGVPHAVQPKFQGDGSGKLDAVTKTGEHIKCPLKDTTVSAHVSGNVTRVVVKQLFTNPLAAKIEAVYTFPLSDTGAVDDMLMKVGARTIHGTIKKREEARAIYEAARNSGHVAALLDQERPNIFTQSVANIEPHKDIEVTISYVDMLPYEAGTYTFAFPTVVGPRFNPGTSVGHQGTGLSDDTTEVPDASKISPTPAAEGTRAGHDINISVSIDSAVPVLGIKSALHEVNTTNQNEHHVDVALVNKNTIPNKDFVLNWTVASDQVRSGYLTNAKDGQGFFNLSIIPPKRPHANQVQPKEMVFLIDCSGSQSGAPLDKCKEVMHYALDHMNDDDTFQVITFNNSATLLFPHAEKATGAMRERARKFIDGLQANGGTWMAPAVEKACSMPADDHRLRIVSFMTDGYVGNDFEIIGLVKKLRGKSRWFPFGTGNSVNRFLIDNIAKTGGGEADYVYLNSKANEVGKKFYDKIASPVLTDVEIAFSGVEVKEVFPKDIADVWAEKPLYFTGRFAKPGHGNVTISGFSGGKPYKQTLAVDLPANNPANDVLGSLWARAKVDRLMAEDWFGAQAGSVNKELKEEIVRTALEHHIMTQYTSFVAVEEDRKTADGKIEKLAVPIEMPEGVSREKVYGKNLKAPQRQQYAASPKPALRGTSLNGFIASAGGSAYGDEGFYKQAPAASFGYLPQVNMGAFVGAGHSRYTHAAAPPPIASPMPMAVGQRRAAQKVQFYNAPAQTQILLANKGEAQSEKKDADKESLQAVPGPSRIDAQVQKWLDGSKPGDTLKIELTLASSAEAKRVLAIQGVRLYKRTGKVIVAFVSREALQKLIAMNSVMSMKKAD
jgi:Ca-activated chloride channel family protein